MRKILFTTIINFCSNDLRFLKKCIEEAQVFSDQVLVVSSDHFFDGTKENRQILENAYSLDATFIEYAFDSKRLYSQFIDSNPTDPNWQMYWYGTSRFVGFFYSKGEFLLFLDADEIIDGRAFLRWWEKGRSLNAYRLRSYFYFHRPDLSAKTFPTNALLVRKKALNPHFLINEWDRKGVFSRVSEPKAVVENPLVHHYSWVKTKEECYKKAATSGHWWEKDWKKLIDTEFEKGTDFAFSYEYEEVTPFFDPLSYEPQPEKRGRAVFVTREDVLKKELEYEFNV